MGASNLLRKKSFSLRDKLSNSDFPDSQAIVLERAFANLDNFVPSYWLREFKSADFTEEQATVLVDVLANRATR